MTTRKIAIREATYRARKEFRSIAVRKSKNGVWFTNWTTVPLQTGSVEVATVHCDGRVEYTGAST